MHECAITNYLNTCIQGRKIDKTQQGKPSMKTLRIKESQQEQIRQIAIAFNKKLVNLGKAPLQDSTLVHILLDESLKRAHIDDNGNIEIK